MHPLSPEVVEVLKSINYYPDYTGLYSPPQPSFTKIRQHTNG